MTPPIDADRLRRDHGLHRAAQLLADATRIRQGLSAQPLARLNPDDREWFKQTARHQIEVFELVTQPDREPDAVREQREAEDRRLATALENRFAIERSRASVTARERGHKLATWHRLEPETGQETSFCLRCMRIVRITLGDEPTLSGAALTEGCLTAAGKETL